MSNLFMFTLMLVFTFSKAWFNDPGKVHISDVKSITLHQGQWTTGRRNPAVPQLKCVGGSAGCSAFIPSVVQCQNVGSDGYDAQWKCEADKDDSYKFGKLQVTCEGYDYPNDPYVLRGSCGLEYTIDYTESGRNKHFYNNYSYSNQSRSGWKFLFFLIFVVFLLKKLHVIGWLWEKISRSPNSDSSPDHRPDNNFSSSFSSPKSNVCHEGLTPTAPPSYDDATTTQSEQPQSNNTNRDRFWSGLSMGGLLGYLFGSWGNSGRHNTGYFRGYQSGYHNGWSSRPTWGSSSWGSSSNRRNWGTSSSSRVASGYGGTSRR